MVLSGLSASSKLVIVAPTQQQADALKNYIVLRGFDQVECRVLSSITQFSPLKTVELLIIQLATEHQNTGLALLQALAPHVATIVITDRFDEDFFMSCHDAGTREFIQQPVPESYLVSRVLHVLDDNQRRHQLAHQQELLKELSVVSTVSGLFLPDVFQRLVQRASKDSCLLLLRTGNEQGLSAGTRDAVLGEVAQLLRQCIRTTDIPGELGTGLFGIVMPNTTLEGARTVTQRIQTQWPCMAMPSGALPSFALSLALFSQHASPQECVQHALSTLVGPAPVSH